MIFALKPDLSAFNIATPVRGNMMFFLPLLLTFLSPYVLGSSLRNRMAGRAGKEDGIEGGEIPKPSLALLCCMSTI